MLFKGAQVAQVGAALTAPALDAGSLEVSSWRWVVCIRSTKDCEPAKDGSKRSYRVTALDAGNDVRVEVGLGGTGLTVLSAPVLIGVGE